MGYSIWIIDHNVKIHKEHFEEAKEYLFKFCLEHGIHANQVDGFYGWTESSFDECLNEFTDYHPELNEEGDIDGFEYTGDRLLDDYELWSSLAPFVEDGSYIEIEGDDFDRWRWIFRNGEMKPIWPKVIWEE